MTSEDSLLILRGPDIHAVLDGCERDIIAAVRAAYLEHRAGNSWLPHSVFVRFPERTKERIIALPGYLGGAEEIAGIKWIASFPKNLERGMSRASAVMVLNSLETGRPEAVLESSIISSARTASSAALAADVLHAPGDIKSLGLVGCGLINREIVRFIASLDRRIGRILAYDIDAARADRFADILAPITGGVPYETRSSVDDLLASSAVVSFATTAVEPTVSDLSICGPATTILHISLRDLTAEVIEPADNVVDDVDHVMRALTSVHLAEQTFGHRRFVRCTLADVMAGEAPPRRDSDSLVVFSPFGLGVLDLALGGLVLRRAAANGTGTRIDGFFEGT